jgi:hypothetical protein
MRLIIGLLIALLIAAFLLWSSISVGSVLYEWLSAFPIFSSPLWLKIRVPAITIGVIAFIALLLIANSYNNRRLLKKTIAYAESQGWGFSEKDTLGLKAVFEELYTERQYNLTNIRIVENGTRNLYLIDYYSMTRSGRSNTRWGTACLIRSDAFTSIAAPVYVDEKAGVFDKLLSDKVDMGDTPFAAEFVVQCKDPASAQRAINPVMQAILLEYLKSPSGSLVGVVIGPRGAVLMTSSTVDHELWQFLLEFARRIESAMR